MCFFDNYFISLSVHLTAVWYVLMLIYCCLIFFSCLSDCCFVFPSIFQCIWLLFHVFICPCAFLSFCWFDYSFMYLSASLFVCLCLSLWLAGGLITGVSILSVKNKKSINVALSSDSVQLKLVAWRKLRTEGWLLLVASSQGSHDKSIQDLRYSFKKSFPFRKLERIVKILRVSIRLSIPSYQFSVRKGMHVDNFIISIRLAKWHRIFLVVRVGLFY